MLMKRWIAEIERYGGVRTNVITYKRSDPDDIEGEVIPWAIHIYRGDLPRGVGSFYPPLGLLGRILQPVMFWLYVREVRKAVRELNQ